ncbi:hypothetical protein LCGC14_0817490 [marine sediment metagenome]|uniref:Uncharacterized protein n=1 Tax=marine sediment metagenome TaxID=412755 RepID=A0A0F9PPJ4_9ZZZZ
MMSELTEEKLRVRAKWDESDRIREANTCTKCGQVRQPLSNGIPHYCEENVTSRSN